MSLFLFFLIIIYNVSANSKHQSIYYQQWCAANGKKPDYCTYLDDTGCNKYFPQTYDRDFMCPNVFDQPHLNGYNPATDFNKIVVNTTGLNGLTNPNFYINVILVRRNQTGHPFYKYIGLNQNIVYQPWSSSKCFAIINAASTMRVDCDYKLGLNSYENNKDDELGDLATIIHSYGSNPGGFESNCLAYYMLDIGGRQKLDNNIHEWLGGSSSDTLGGNYGCSDTYGLGMKFTEINNITNQCSIPNSKMVTIPNSLSAIAESEFYKRIVMTRENPEYAYPNTEWEDIKQLMYGPSNSTMFPGILWGGGTTDTAWYIQSGLPSSNSIDMIDLNTQGNWRIFSKLGAGNSDIVYNGYGCLPRYNGNNVIPNSGVEFILSLRYTSTSDLCYTDKLVHENIQPIIEGIMDGSIS